MSLDPHEQNNRIPFWKREQGLGHWRKDNRGVAGGAVWWKWDLESSLGPAVTDDTPDDSHTSYWPNGILFSMKQRCWGDWVAQ